MEISTAAGSDIIIRGLGDGDKKFARLSVRDLGALQQMVNAPEEQRPFISIPELYRWANTIPGSVEVLLMASRKIDPKTSREHIEELASPMQLVKAGAAVMLASLSNGEEEDGKAAKSADPLGDTATG